MGIRLSGLILFSSFEWLVAVKSGSSSSAISGKDGDSRHGQDEQAGAQALIRKEVEEWVATAKKEGLYGHRDGGLYPDDHGNLMAVVNKFVKFGVSWESIGRITNAPISFRTNRKIKSGVTYTLHVGYLCFFFSNIYRSVNSTGDGVNSASSSIQCK